MPAMPAMDATPMIEPLSLMTFSSSRWRVICSGEAMPVAEKALGWPVRSGRLVLRLALDRLADFYRLPG